MCVRVCLCGVCAFFCPDAFCRRECQLFFCRIMGHGLEPSKTVTVGKKVVEMTIDERTCETVTKKILARETNTNDSNHENSVSSVEGEGVLRMTYSSGTMLFSCFVRFTF